MHQASPIDFASRLLSIEERRGKFCILELCASIVVSSLDICSQSLSLQQTMIEESLLEKVDIEMTTLGVKRTMAARTIVEEEAVGTMVEAVVMRETICVVNQVNIQAKLGAMADATQKGLIRMEERLFVKQQSRWPRHEN